MILKKAKSLLEVHIPKISRNFYSINKKPRRRFRQGFFTYLASEGLNFCLN